MAAIVTSNFRVLNAENFKADVGTDKVYVGIGKADAWSNSTSDVTDDPVSPSYLPNDHLDDEGQARANLLALKKVAASDISHVVTRYDWASGTTYDDWDSADPNIFDKKFYVLTSEFKVYKCIFAPSNASTIQPVQTLTAPTAESDGYIWKYMYTISTADSEKFLTTSYMPVKTVSLAYANDAAAESALSEADYAQYLNQKASRDHAKAGGLERIVVTGNGTGYDSKPTVTISGDGSGATVIAAQVTMAGSGGSQTVSAIALTDKGTDYRVAKISFSGGTPDTVAQARAVISPKQGHGVDPIRELGSFFISLNAKLDNSSGDDITTGNDFRQVLLLKDPQVHNAAAYGGAAATADVIKPMNGLDVSSGTIANLQVDEVIVGGSGNTPTAFVTEVDTTNGIVYYHQNDKTGFEPFDNGETITGQTSTTALVLESSNANVVSGTGVDRRSGELLFLEHRSPISRSATQIEDIKVIIEF